MLAATAIGVVAPHTAVAHPLDELVQSAFFTVHRDSLFLELDFVAGARVAPAYFAFIDRDHNGRIDAAERRLYIAAVERELQVGVQTHARAGALTMRLEADRWPTDAQLRDGEGMIRLFWRAAMPTGTSSDSAPVVTFANRHAPVGSSYLVNALVDSLTLPIVATHRSWTQQEFALTVSMSASGSASVSPARANAIDLSVADRWLRVLPSFIRHGMYHVATGFDHVLFVIALLLAGGRWSRIAGIVTSFTVAHSVTLTLAVLGIVVPPARPVEAAIAASIVAVGWQAFRAEAHPGRPGVRVGDPRFALAFGFGLLHGFGFATAMQTLPLPAGQLPIALAGFNIGVEAAQLGIVFTVWPLLSLVRLRTSPRFAARVIRVCAALVMVTGGYWFAERVLS